MKCFVCNNNQWSNKYDNLLKCEKCGFIRARNHFFDISPGEIYNQKYFSKGDYADYIREESSLVDNFKNRLKEIVKFKKRGQLLEIGSAYGYFLKEADKYFAVTGIDIDSYVCEQARNISKKKIICGNFLDINFKNKKYDVICLFDTIEHLKQPKEYLQKIFKLLKNDGIVAIETGDIASLLPNIQGNKWRLIKPKYHLSYFSESTLTRLLRKIGFKIVHISHPAFARSIQQIIYKLFGFNLNRNNSPSELKIKINTFDIVFVIAKK